MTDTAATTPSTKSDGPKRKIAGNFPYISNYGSIKAVLDKIITASRPDKLTQDYLANVLGLSGGSYRVVLPILRRVGLLTSDGTPTETYTMFRSDSDRAEAVYLALKHGFPELFKRSENVYAVPDAKLLDLICQVTGLTKDDQIAKNIKGTFKAFSAYLPDGFSTGDLVEKNSLDTSREPAEIPNPQARVTSEGGLPWGLSYQINIVLPESKDADVFNAIFKSLRENLLR